MGRWSAVSDLDYYDEQRHIPKIARRPRCLTCGEPMDVVCNGDGEPIHAHCEHCEPTKELR